MPHVGRDGITRKVVCLVGSTLFKDAFEEQARREALKGHIVLSIDSFIKSKDYPENERDPRLSPAVCTLLDRLMEAKIDLSDEVIVICLNGYIGESGVQHIAYAKQHGKPIRYIEEL